MIKKVLRLWCLFVVGHCFQSNHVGVIRCKRCGQPWEVQADRES